MSDYLGRLAARVLAPERAIRPRMHSPFESVGSEIEVIAEAGPRAVSVRREHERRSVAPRETVETTTHRLETQSPVELLPKPHAEVRAEEREAARDAPRDSETRIEEREIIRERQESEPPPNAEPVVFRELAQLPPRVQTVVRERRSLEHVERFRVRTEHGETAARNAAAMAPVEITIGRIDVRAVVSATPLAPSRQRERPATMSLRDYLARRDERRRG